MLMLNIQTSSHNYDLATKTTVACRLAQFITLRKIDSANKAYSQ